MSNKILISGGKVFTGSKEDKASIQNIYIENGVIKKISSEKIEVSKDTRIIDASSKWVTPGFIDTHTHYDAEVIVSPGLLESARHGVTSVVMGSCSVSAVLNNPEETSDSFTRVEAIPREVFLPILEEKKSWQTPQEWVDYIERQPLGVNVSSFLGHSDLRVKAMGIDRALSHDIKASPEEQTKMQTILNEALDAGFLGLSTMDNPWDKMDGDKYWSHKTPSFYSTWKERKPLLSILRERNAILQGAPNLVTRISAVNYMLSSVGIGRKPLKTTMIAMMDLIADRGLFNVLQLGCHTINKVLNGNFRMQSTPSPFTVYYDGVDSVMFEEFPAGEAMRHLAKNIDERNDLIRDPEFRKTFKKALAKKYTPRVWHRDLGMAVVLECPDQSIIGKNFIQIAEEKGGHPAEVFLDYIVKYDKQIKWTTTIANDRKDKYHRLYNFEHNIISFSDAGAHLNNMAFYDFPLQMMKNVKDTHDAGKPMMSMEKCVWRVTGELADWFGLDCGHIQEGRVADINIIDPALFHTVQETVEEDIIPEFNNCPRLVNRNNVMQQVLVGGHVIYEDGKFVEGYGKTKKYGRYLGGGHTAKAS